MRDFDTKKKLIWMIYILIIFTAITVIKKNENDFKNESFNFDTVTEEEQYNIEFDIVSIDIDKTENNKDYYKYLVKVSDNFTEKTYTEIISLILNEVKVKDNFERLSISIVDNKNKELFNFLY